jgi:response regulator of citrate/malate metabolism
VLIVEDDALVATVHCRTVKRVPGFEVVGIGRSAAEARSLLPALRPDLLVLDLGLRGESGIDLLRSIRGEGRPIEAIAVTAHSAGDIVRAMFQLGVIDYLVKPFAPERLERGLQLFVHRMDAYNGRHLEQSVVDSVRASVRWLPKDIAEERLEDVRAALTNADGPLTAEEVGRVVCVARVTARRYLEYLVATGQATATPQWGARGRPRNAYAMTPAKHLRRRAGEDGAQA